MKKIKAFFSINIQTKCILGFSVILCLSFFLEHTSSVTIEKLNASFEKLYANVYMSSSFTKNAKINLMGIKGHIQSISYNKDKEIVEELGEETLELFEAFYEDVGVVQERSSQNKEIHSLAISLENDARRLQVKFINTYNEKLQNLENEIQLDDELAELSDSLDELNDRFSEIGFSFYNDSKKENTQVIKLLEQTMIILSSSIVLIGFLLVLTIVLPIKKIIKYVGGSSSALENTSNSINEKSSTLNDSAISQAREVESATRAIESIAEMISETASSVSICKELSEKGLEESNIAGRSNQELIEAIEKMNLVYSNVQKEFQNNNEKLTDVIKLVNEIDIKARAIGGIVKKTQMLSINASIEAARAGEHGKGFSVVADEIRVLAEHSGKAAKDIEEILGTSIETVEDIIFLSKEKLGGYISKGIETSKYSENLLNNCSENLKSIVGHVESIADLATSIDKASIRQQEDIRKVEDVVLKMNKESKENLEIATSIRHCSDELNLNQEELDKAVGTLETLVSSKILKLIRLLKGEEDKTIEEEAAEQDKKKQLKDVA